MCVLALLSQRDFWKFIAAWLPSGRCSVLYTHSTWLRFLSGFPETIDTGSVHTIRIFYSNYVRLIEPRVCMYICRAIAIKLELPVAACHWLKVGRSGCMFVFRCDTSNRYSLLLVGTRPSRVPLNMPPLFIIVFDGSFVFIYNIYFLYGVLLLVPTQVKGHLLICIHARVRSCANSWCRWGCRWRCGHRIWSAFRCALQTGRRMNGIPKRWWGTVHASETPTCVCVCSACNARMQHFLLLPMIIIVMS